MAKSSRKNHKNRSKNRAGSSRAEGRTSKNEPKHLNDLLVTKLQALRDVEQQIIKALPKMASKSTDPDLKAGFEKHLEETREHESRLGEALDLLGEKQESLKVEAIRGLINDTDWVIKNVKGSEALDANLIAAAQYAEHYEIAGYGSASEWARLLGRDDVADLLELTLQEEKDSNRELQTLAESKINERALGDESEIEMEVEVEKIEV